MKNLCVLLSLSLLCTLVSAVPRQNLGGERSASSQRFTFKLSQCGRSGGGVACDFWITNEGEEERHLYLLWHESKMVGDDGEEYTASSIEFEGARRIHVNNGVAARGKVTPAISFHGKIRFDDASPSINSITSVRLLGRVFDYKVEATFRDIPLTGVSRREIPNSQPSRNYGTFSPPTYSYQRREETFTLSQLNRWVNTGIEVRPDMRLVISSSGMINVRNARSRTPNPTGIDLVIDRTLGKDGKLRERTVGAGDVNLKVVYSDGGESSAVRIGSNKYEFKPRKRGMLALGIPQPYAGDTSGAISVLVQW